MDFYEKFEFGFWFAVELGFASGALVERLFFKMVADDVCCDENVLDSGRTLRFLGFFAVEDGVEVGLGGVDYYRIERGRFKTFADGDNSGNICWVRNNVYGVPEGAFCCEVEVSRYNDGACYYIHFSDNRGDTFCGMRLGWESSKSLNNSLVETCYG